MACQITKQGSSGDATLPCPAMTCRLDSVSQSACHKAYAEVLDVAQMMQEIYKTEPPAVCTNNPYRNVRKK